MIASEIMTRELHECGPGDSLHAAAKMMWDHDCGCVPVVDDQRRVIGMITDRDVCMAAFTRNQPLTDVLVSEAMSRSVVYCAPDDSLEAVERSMASSQVRRMPVVDDGKLVGIVSLNDLTRAVVAAAGKRKKGLPKAADLVDALAAVGSPPARPAA